MRVFYKGVDFIGKVGEGSGWSDVFVEVCGVSVRADILGRGKIVWR